jgi:cobyrinic acid a,c-diamide synthase
VHAPALAIGYREVEVVRASPLMAPGTRVRGHEFLWPEAGPPPARLAAYRVVGQNRLEGFCVGATRGSYVHFNFAGQPDRARRFVASCAATATLGA